MSSITQLQILVISLLHVSNCYQTQTYEYIIVGGGSAGATLAARLSETSTVLLLEAGPKPPQKSEIPLLFANYESDTEINWNYTIEAHEGSCLGLKNKRCPYFMGRTLGGTSAINYMLYVRGSKKDYDLWKKNGAEGWGYDDVLPYFKKAEGVRIDKSIIDEDFHGKNGPLTVSVSSYSTVLKDAYLNSTKQLGYNITDYNGQHQNGFTVAQLTVRDGYRCSTEKAYLRPAYSRYNLKIKTGAYVTKVKIVNKVAKGVFYIKDNGSGNKTYYEDAKKEVILCAGAIKSPQILMLSGIGPKQHLKDMNIEVIKDLPVGKNLQDHVGAAGVFYTVDNAPDVPTFTNLINYTTLPNYEFPKTLSGVLSSPGILEVFGYLKSPYETEVGDYNDVQLFFLSNLVFQKDFNDEVKKFFAENGYFNEPAFLIAPTVLHPKSRGIIALRSKVPTEPPAIQMNYYTDPHDMKVIIYAIKKANDLVTKTAAFKKLNPKLIGPVPGCQNYSLSSDDYFECVARQLTVSIYHACGTCKMGRVDDPTTVVDPQLRVKGIKKLRVVDASIMPMIVSANTNAPTIMIAEKAADMIKGIKTV